jgi:hypothetical protein
MKRNLLAQLIKSIVLLFVIMLISAIYQTSFGQFNMQIMGVNQVVDGTRATPFIQGMNVTFNYYDPPGGIPQFLNIYAQIPGQNNWAWVAVNIYLDTFPATRILNRTISLNHLGIPDNQRITALNLFAENTVNALVIPSNPVNFIPYNCTLDTTFMYDTFNGDPEGVIAAENTPAAFAGPIQASLVRGCNVPNVDLDNGNHPPNSGYAGDHNACAPASVANSLNWIETSTAGVGSDGLTERQRLEELSALMGRLAGGGATADQIIQAKISFIANHGLKLKIEYHAASGNPDDDLAWLQTQYNDGQDIELDYTYKQDGETKSHAVVLTDFKITGSVPQVSYKDDKNQKKPGGTTETTSDLRRGPDGHLSFVRDGIFCTINNMYAESYDPTVATPDNPACNRVKKDKCEGNCPPLVRYFDGNGNPVTTYPVCDKKRCCDISDIYTDASGTCQANKKGDCKGQCAYLYASKDDALKKKNPIRGTCGKAGGCKCEYKPDKGKSTSDDEVEEVHESTLAEGQLELFPNPALDKISINVTGFEGTYKVQLINILGNPLITKTIDLDGEGIYTLDVSSFSHGIYIILLSNDESISKGMFLK